jgi:hypothetical protein
VGKEREIYFGKNIREGDIFWEKYKRGETCVKVEGWDE